MYHDVLPETSPAGGGPGRFTVSTTSFEMMLDAITEAGCSGCAMDTARQDGGGSRVGITFDDGTEGQFIHAVPALRARAMTATFFVTTDWVGKSGFMDWHQLRQLRSWGMSVQSHTKSHPHLSELDEDGVRLELVESKRALDRALDQDTDQIALPGGNAPRMGLRSLLGECGYSMVATSRWGTNREDAGLRDGVYRVRRCTAPGSADQELARRIVQGDRRLAAARRVRETTLNGVRAAMGADRYAWWRRRFLDLVSR